MTNGCALNHDISLQIYFFCVKRQAKNGFLKGIESTEKSLPTVTAKIGSTLKEKNLLPEGENSSL